MENQENIQDIRKSTIAYIKKHYLWHFILLSILFVSIFVFFLMTGNLAYAWLSLFAMLLYVEIYRRARTKMDHMFMREFAASIGYSYSQEGKDIDIKGKLPLLGYNQSFSVSDVLSGVHNNLPIKIFLYFSTFGSRKSARKFCYTVFEITFHSKMPRIFLHSNLWLSSLRGNYLRLEGDFNRYFSLWVTKEFEAEAYEIFTPDIMATLIEKAKNLNFEFIDDKLYIYNGKIINTKEEMEKIYSLVDYLADLFKKTISDIHIDQNPA